VRLPYLATAIGDNTARVWEVTSGREVVRFIQLNVAGTIAFAPDGQHLATASGEILLDNNTVGVWSSIGNHKVARLIHDQNVTAVAFNPDGHYLATASRDHTARVWRFSNGEEIMRLVHNDSLNAVAFSSTLSIRLHNKRYRLSAARPSAGFLPSQHQTPTWQNDRSSTTPV
jgi:dipeptidyl aminopeptidase/acylaminoacyl peptidase